jgi:uncharacterized membrane protein
MPLGTRLFFGAFGIAMFWYATYALRNGELPLRISRRYRDANPIYFWWSVIASIVMGMIFIVVALFGDSGR